MDTSANRTDLVLVIDDDAIMRDLLSLLLGAEGHTVLTAESGEAALTLLDPLEPGERPSVLLTDLKMPGVSQSALAIRLRLVCPRPAVLVAMSASEPDPVEVVAFDAFLSKPFEILDYNAAVERARSHAAAGELSDVQASAPPVSSKTSRSAPDRARIAARVLNETIYAKLSSVMGTAELPSLYTLFLDDAAARSSRMRSAAAVNDAVTFTREAHAIKGGCGMLGATELYSLASRMETGGLACSSLVDDFQPAMERLRRILEERMNGTSTA